MEKIASFKVHHTNLKRGVYVSRIDTVGNEKVTTFDIRMKTPNRGPRLDPKVQHTIEHLAATYLRNDEEFAEQVIYWGPMGCMTGSYLIVKGEKKPEDVMRYLCQMFLFISCAYEVPGATIDECGSYDYHDLYWAREEARTFLNEVLMQKDIPTEYPDE